MGAGVNIGNDRISDIKVTKDELFDFFYLRILFFIIIRFNYLNTQDIW